MQQEFSWTTGSYRPVLFEEFIGQKSIISVLETALASSKKKWHTVWHMLLCGQSWFGKTTLSSIVASQSEGGFHQITWYALSKPSEMVSLLNSLQPNDVLFIDEIHRLKAPLEEVLYIAMEDYCIDMIMPDWSSVRLPLHNFTLIGATTKSEALSEPLKNRFIYSFHLAPYTDSEKQQILERYLEKNGLSVDSNETLSEICSFVSSTPREITTLCIQLRDYCIVHNNWIMKVTMKTWNWFRNTSSVWEWWIKPVHKRYLAILSEADGKAVWLSTLSAKLWISEKALENDVEPLLFQLWKIDKTNRWRILV